MYQLYLVQHPLGDFIGVARNPDQAQLHFGTVATIHPLPEQEKDAKAIIEEKNYKVFLAL